MIKGSGCLEAFASLLGFGTSRLYVVMMLFHPLSYREGSLPSPEGLPDAAQEHRASSWLPCWTISWPKKIIYLNLSCKGLSFLLKSGKQSIT